MRTQAFLIIVACFVLFVSACQPAPTSPPLDLDGAAEPAGQSDADASVGGDEAPEASESGEEETSRTADSDEDAAAEAEAETEAEAEVEPAPSDVEPGDVVASVNGEPIALGDFQRQAFDTQRYFVDQGLDPNSDDGQRRLLALRRQVLDDMINQKLLEQAGAELGIEVTEQELQEHMDAQIENVGGQDKFDENLLRAGTTLDEVMEMERSGLFGQKVLEVIAGDIPETAEFVHARHILCETGEDCEEALERIEAGETFEEVAADLSSDSSSADQGGDLGWVGRGMLPSQQVEDAIFSLAEGEMSDVTATDFGYHVFEAIERDDDRAVSDEMRFQLREKALLDWLADRRARSDIEIFVEDLKTPEE